MAEPTTVAVLSPFAGGFYFGSVLSGVAAEVAAAGGRIVLIQTHDAGLSGDEVLTAPKFAMPLGWDRVHGVVALAASVEPEYLDRLMSAAIPVVLAGHEMENLDVPSVVADNHGGIEGLVDHLIEVHGHTRIAFVGNLDQSDMRARYAAYRDALERHGIAPDDRLFYEAPGNNEAGGRAVGTHLVEDVSPPTAAVVATDRNAMGLMDSLRSSGVRVPEDVAVVSFDNVEPLISAFPELTTVDQQFAAMGARAARVLLSSRRGGSAPAASHLSESRIVMRTSCGCTTGEATGTAPQRAGRTTLVDALAEALSPHADGLHGSGGPRTVAERLARAFERDLAATPGAEVSALLEVANRLPPGGIGPEALRQIVKLLGAQATSSPTGPAAPGPGWLAEAASAMWGAHAAGLLSRVAALEDAAAQQHLVSMQLLGSGGEAARSLHWLEGTGVAAACLGVWSDVNHTRVRITGVHDRDGGIGPLSKLVGNELPVQEFPPTELLARSSWERQEIAYVIPVRSRGSDWGMLAVVDGIDARSMRAGAGVNHWAALLAVALTQAAWLEAVSTSEERYALAAEASNDGLWDWDLRTGAAYYSDRCRDMLGLEADEGGQEALYDAAYPHDLDGLREALAFALSPGSPPALVECRLRGADGTYRWFECRARTVGVEGQPAHRLVGSLSDIDSRKRGEERLSWKALHDPLTGLPNREAFHDGLSERLRSLHDGSDPRAGVAVLFVDLDGFKEVNDRLGHAAGDLVLVAVAERLAHAVRPDDLAARFGGDEFAVMVAGHAADAVTERIRSAVAQPIPIPGGSATVTASVGAVVAGVGSQMTASELIAAADMRMYSAKAEARRSRRASTDDSSD